MFVKGSNTENTRAGPSQAEWFGGWQYNRPKREFQLLLRETGSFKRAKSLAFDCIIWPEKDGKELHPPEKVMRKWALEYDEGEIEFDEKMEKAFLARVRNMVKSSAEWLIMENARTGVMLNEQIREGKFDPAKSSLFMHANNGTFFGYDKVANGRRNDKPQQQVIVLPFKEPPRPKKLPAGRVIDVTAREVPVRDEA